MDPVVTTHDCHDLDAVRSGDLDAFGRIHDRHAPLVFALCRRRGVGGPGGSPADADDATQEVFIRAYRKLDTLEDCTRLRAWLCGIAKFVVRERSRAASRRRRHEGDAMTAAITKTSPPIRPTHFQTEKNINKTSPKHQRNITKT